MSHDANDVIPHRNIAVDCFNATWTLIEKADRTPDETAEMIHMAHASRFHWGQVADVTPTNLSVGDWQVSTVLARAGLPDAALYHAARCLAGAEAHDLPPFYAGYGHEAHARAYAAAKDAANAGKHLDLAAECATRVEDAEERGWLEADIAAIRAMVAA